MSMINPNDEWRVDGGALSGIHDTRVCDCELCAAADEYEAREAHRVSEAAHEAKTSPQRPESPGITPPGTVADPVQSTFDALWSCTPLVIRESTERDICEYFYRMGCADGREATIATTNDDLKEMRRLAGERLR